MQMLSSYITNLVSFQTLSSYLIALCESVQSPSPHSYTVQFTGEPSGIDHKKHKGLTDLLGKLIPTSKNDILASKKE